MSDILDIKRALQGRAKEIAEYLLPNGVLEAREWCVGSIGGERGRSLKVCVNGAKAGTWADFAAGQSGDLIDLWREVRGGDLPATLDAIRSYLGIEAPRFEKPAKQYRRPERPKCTVPKSAVRDYLIGQRKVSDGAMAAYRVGEKGRDMVFPSLVGGELLFVKYLSVDRNADGKKVTNVEAGCEPVLFGWQAIDANARSVTITEGEIDALTGFDYGFPALSVPFGGGKGAKQQWIVSEFERLARFETIYLALDMDAEGEAAVSEIVARLGRPRCRRVTLPKKDLNECRMAGIPVEVIAQCFADARTMDPEELRRAGEFTEEVLRLFWPTDDGASGYRLPFHQCRDKVRFRPGEMSIWTGPSGAGKSQLLSHACVDWGDQGARVCIASLEMAPRQLLKRMVKQAGLVDRPTEPYLRAVMGWLDEWLWVFNLVGKAGVKPMLEVFEYARARYGCDVFIIDSLMRLGIGSEDYEGQERAVFEIVTWAVEKEVHVHLVAHARKGDSKFGGEVPETEDIKGASEIGSNAFNIVGVWRNRKLEDDVKAATEMAERGDQSARLRLEELAVKPAVVMNIAKQRNGDWEGKVGLWFDQRSYQYRARDDSRNGMRYVPWEGMEMADAAQ